MNSNDFLSRGRGAAPTVSESVSHANKKGPKGSGALRVVFGALIVSIALLALLLVAFVAFGGGKSDSGHIKEDKYQAVFLNDQNGQVYFGKLSELNSKYYRLTDIFYVRVEQVQPSEENTQATQNISLAKLGNELHGPEDEMFIAKDKVLFWENLKDNGKVVEAIVKFKQDGGNTDTSNDTSNNTTEN